MSGGRFMIDLESLGDKPGSVILSIGVVEFGEAGIHREFSVNIDPEDCESCGLTCNVSTVLWWLKQSEAARNAIVDAPDRKSLFGALQRLRVWMLTNGPIDEVWSCGATFDLKLLEAAFAAVEVSLPWFFYNERCFRTMKNQVQGEGLRVDPMVAHVAIEDARAQAQWLINIERKLTMLDVLEDQIKFEPNQENGKEERNEANSTGEN